MNDHNEDKLSQKHLLGWVWHACCYKALLPLPLPPLLLPVLLARDVPGGQQEGSRT
jgi:hypothetical protein